MANDFIGIDITGDKELAAKLARLPVCVQDEAVVTANTYIVKIMQEYQTYTHIWRSRAFPHLRFTTPKGKIKIGYASWAQFKLVHALASQGKLPYRRTQTLRKNWKTYGTGRQQFVANETPYAPFVMGDDEQDGLHKKMGWKTVKARMADRRSMILRNFEAGVKKGIKKAGIK